MTLRTAPLVVLLDEGTPVLAAEPFLTRHNVIYHNDILESGSKDEIVAAAAILNKAILMAVDLDMKRLVRRFGSPNQNEKFKNLNLIHIGCHETLAAKRLQHCLSFIENEWTFACEKKSRRLWVSIESHRIISYR